VTDGRTDGQTDGENYNSQDRPSTARAVKKGRDKTPAHRINVQSLTELAGEQQVVDSTPV